MEQELFLGAFAMDDSGRIALRDGRGAGFGFRWRGRDMRVELDRVPDEAPGREPRGTPRGEPRGEPGGTTGSRGGVVAGRADCRMRLSARAGRVPSSATGATLRPDAFQMVRQLAAVLPSGWRATLQADHVLTLFSDTRMALPAMIGDVLVPATRFALELAPYLDLFEQYGMDMNA